MKITKSEIDRLIKEEFQKMLEKKKLTARLNQINEEIEKMNNEDDSLNEVEAGGKTKVSSHAWTGKENGDEKFEPKFEKKGTHLKEEDEEGSDLETSLEIGAEESNIEGGIDTETTPMGEFEAKFAALGKILDAKLSGDSSEESTMDDTTSGDDFEEVEVQNDAPTSDSIDTEVTGEEGATDSEEEIDEYKEVVGGVGAEQGMTADDAVKKESVEEPLEGHSVAQEAPADKVNDNMEKVTHVKEGKAINESKTVKGNIFTEGLEDKKKSALLEELNRMKKFAGLSKDEE